MPKKQGRYFYRNTGAHLVEPKIAAEVATITPIIPQDDPAIVELPQNSGSITAEDSVTGATGVYQSFLFGLYSVITFLSMIVLVFTWMKPPAITSLPAYDLLHRPASASSHLKYIEWLVANYRLMDVEREQLFLSRASSRGWYKDLDDARFKSLQAEATHKQEIFRSLISEYAYWHRTNKEYSNYRDGLYRASQLSYMLINDVESRQLLGSSYALDPQFQLAFTVSTELKRY